MNIMPFFVALLFLIISILFLIGLVAIIIWSFERIGYHLYEYKRKRWIHEND